MLRITQGFRAVEPLNISLPWDPSHAQSFWHVSPLLPKAELQQRQAATLGFQQQEQGQQQMQLATAALTSSNSNSESEDACLQVSNGWYCGTNMHCT
jgi:hypothetical protein